MTAFCAMYALRIQLRLRNHPNRATRIAVRAGIRHDIRVIRAASEV
jgi:hypothetical protein